VAWDRFFYCCCLPSLLGIGTIIRAWGGQAQKLPPHTPARRKTQPAYGSTRPEFGVAPVRVGLADLRCLLPLLGEKTQQVYVPAA
jgi:hypothetical protein